MDIPIEDIEDLRSLRFSWTKVADLLGISRSTLYRRLDEHGIQRDTHYSNVTDFELEELLNPLSKPS